MNFLKKKICKVVKTFLAGLLFFSFKSVAVLDTKVIKGPILSFLPSQFNAHDIFVFSLDKKKSPFYSPSVYTLDYSPINQPYILTLIKLLIGLRVPAEIRLRKIPNITIDEPKKIFDELLKMTDSSKISYEESLQMSKIVESGIKNEELKEIVKKAYKWNLKMNLYTHNCQHFSNFLKK
jgi:hypothetical protein